MKQKQDEGGAAQYGALRLRERMDSRVEPGDVDPCWETRSRQGICVCVGQKQIETAEGREK
eukprot:3048469-Rhodomonas_salina.1